MRLVFVMGNFGVVQGVPPSSGLNHKMVLVGKFARPWPWVTWCFVLGVLISFFSSGVESGPLALRRSQAHRYGRRPVIDHGLIGEKTWAGTNPSMTLHVGSQPGGLSGDALPTTQGQLAGELGTIAGRGLPEAKRANRDSYRMRTLKVWSTGASSCEGKMVGHKITITDCSGKWTVVSIYGSFQVECDDFKVLNWLGPLIIKQGHCTIHLTSDYEEFAAEQTAVDYPRPLGSAANISLSVGICLTVVTLLLNTWLYLYLSLKYRSRIDVFAVKSFRREGMSVRKWFVAKASVKKQVNFGGSVGSFLIDVREGETREVFYNSKSVIRYFLLFGLFGSSLAEQGERYNSSYTVGEGDSLIGPGGSFFVEKSHQLHPLVFRYHTGAYETFSEREWFCGWGSCMAHKACLHSLPGGEWNKESLTHHINGSWSMKKEFCSMSANTCMTGYGCWTWATTLMIVDPERFSIYSAEFSKTIVSVVKTRDGTAELLSWSHNSFLDISGYSIIKDKEGPSYICPFPTNHWNPKVGHLGDVQYAGPTEVSIPHDIFKCQEDWAQGPRCESQEPFVGKISGMCKPLPARVGSSQISLMGSELRVMTENGLSLFFTGSGSDTLRSLSGDCGSIQKKIWGIQGSGIPNTLVASSEICTKGTFSKFKIPCLEEEFFIECSCEPHYYTVGELVDCDLTNSSIDVRVIKTSMSNLMQGGSLTFMEEERDNAWGGLLDLSNPLLHGLAALMGGNGVVILFIVLIMLRRR